MGTYLIGCPLDRKARVIVVTHENPAGSRRRYGWATERLKARSPELRSGMGVFVSQQASLRIAHLAGTRNSL